MNSVLFLQHVEKIKFSEKAISIDCLFVKLFPLGASALSEQVGDESSGRGIFSGIYTAVVVKVVVVVAVVVVVVVVVVHLHSSALGNFGAEEHRKYLYSLVPICTVNHQFVQKNIKKNGESLVHFKSAITHPCS